MNTHVTLLIAVVGCLAAGDCAGDSPDSTLGDSSKTEKNVEFLRPFLRRADGVYSIFEAAGAGNKKVLQKRLAEGSSVHEADEMGNTPMHLAAAHGKAAMIAYLLRQGADPLAKNSAGKIPLDLAQGKKTREACAAGIEARRTQMKVIDSLIAGDKQAVRAAIEQGISPNGVTEDRTSTLLVEAVKQGDVSFVAELIQAGADVNLQPAGGNKEGALIVAAKSGTPEMVRLLLDAGADINMRTASCAYPIQEAIWRNRLPVVKELLPAYKAQNFDTPNSAGNPKPACMAIKRGFAEILQALLEAGLNPNDKLYADEPLLTVAAKTGNKRLVEILLNAGADKKAKDKQGKMAGDYAAADIATLLQ